MLRLNEEQMENEINRLDNELAIVKQSLKVTILGKDRDIAAVMQDFMTATGRPDEARRYAAKRADLQSKFNDELEQLNRMHM